MIIMLPGVSIKEKGSHYNVCLSNNYIVSCSNCLPELSALSDQKTNFQTQKRYLCVNLQYIGILCELNATENIKCAG